MSVLVNLVVSFQCNENEGVAEVAKRHLPMIRKTVDGGEAISFLEDLSQRTGTNPGTKGGMSLWGTVGNRIDAETFAESLRPFWNDLLRSRIEGGPFAFQHIVLFYEVEESEHASALEIYLDGDYRERIEDRHLTIKKHENLPFQWV